MNEKVAGGREQGWVLLLGLVVACGLSGCAVADPTFADGVSQGTVTEADVTEASGITASRSNDGVLWLHNDSGDVARVFAIDAHGQLLGTYNIMLEGTSTHADAVDFEDIAIGPGPVAGVTYVYVGDIGDNSAQRANITVYRVAEPVVYGRQSASPVTRNLSHGEWDAITLQYPDGAHNAETLMVDPLTGDLFVGTKQSGVTRVYGATASALASGSPVTLDFVAQVAFNVASGGDISPTGLEIVLRQEDFARLWTRTAAQSVADALGAAPVEIPVVGRPTEGNGEAITFDAIGDDYFTISEGTNQPLYLYERTSDDGPTPPTVLVAAEATWRYLDDGSDQGTAWRTSGFDDSGWSSGPAHLGYGDGDEQTVVSYGGDSSDKHVTTYFRHTFDVDDAEAIGSLRLRLVYDDGAAVYLNGTELVRVNLAADADYDDLATATQYALEGTWFEFAVDSSGLVTGTNTLAVEVHQASVSSSDISFDLQLLATPTTPMRTLTLTETNGPWGEVTFDPEPNDPNTPAFPNGTEVTLTAVPDQGRDFSHWEIFDPNHPNDANYATTDTNDTTRIAMTTDMHVKAVWQCGGQVVPALSMTALLLAAWLGVASRRRA